MIAPTAKPSSSNPRPDLATRKSTGSCGGRNAKTTARAMVATLTPAARDAPMPAKTALSKGVSRLKWLRTPRAACTMISVCSTARPTADSSAAPRTNGVAGRRRANHSSAAPFIPMETLNFSGLIQTGSPITVRGSNTAATARAAVSGTYPMTRRRSSVSIRVEAAAGVAPPRRWATRPAPVSASRPGIDHPARRRTTDRRPTVAVMTKP